MCGGENKCIRNVSLVVLFIRSHRFDQWLFNKSDSVSDPEINSLFIIIIITMIPVLMVLHKQSETVAAVVVDTVDEPGRIALTKISPDTRHNITCSAIK